MWYPIGDFYLGAADVQLSEIAGAPLYMRAVQFDSWQHTKLSIDVVPGRGGMFWLENSEGVRFLTRSDVFTDAEYAALRGVEHCG